MSSNSTILYHIDDVNQLREELLYLSQSPSVDDINKFFRSKNVKNVFLRKSFEWEAEEMALGKVSKTLQALATNDFNGFRKNAKKVFRAEEALKILDYEELFRQILSIYSSYQLTYYKQIQIEKTKQKKQILEEIGVDYTEKTPCRRDVDECEDQNWTPAGQLAAKSNQQEEHREQNTQELILKPVPKKHIGADVEDIYQVVINNPTYTKLYIKKHKKYRRPKKALKCNM